MSEKKKTLSFVGAGGAMLLLAGLAYFMTQPAKTTGFELVGKEFYEEFQSSVQANSLEVLAMDLDSAELQQFRVEEKDGLWTIPSHYGYPAEATDRLARTSSSLIGITREALAGRFKSDHERFGVIDPLSEDNLDPESAGKRITLKDSSGEVLVDLIVGKEAGELQATDSELAFGQESTSTNYYVRRPDEVQTYKVALDLDLSTRFSDWIRPDLLDLDGAEVRRIAIDNYELIEQADPLGRVSRLFKKQNDQMLFDRETGFGPWSLTDLDEETEDLDSGKINTAVSTLDDLKIVGVRKKTSYNGQQLLNADLKFNQIDELKENIDLYQRIWGKLQNELADYGFNLAPVAEDPKDLTIVSNAGQLAAGTGDGVVYTLQFGNPVSGDENEIEIGSAKSGGENPAEDVAGEPEQDSAKTEDGQQAQSDGIETRAEEESKEEVRNRFLMIRVAFDESLLGEKPIAPVEPAEPVKPEGYVPRPETPDEESVDDKAPAPGDEEAPDKTQPDSNADDHETVGSNPNQEDTEAKAGDDRPVEFQDYDLSMTQYPQQKTEYELKLTEFEDASKEFDKKVKAGQQLVLELNERFGAWFYVIAADNLESLQLERADLISEKEKVPTDAMPGNPGLPARPNIKLNDIQPPAMTEDRSSGTVKTKPDASGPVQENEPPAEPANQTAPVESNTEGG